MPRAHVGSRLLPRRQTLSAIVVPIRERSSRLSQEIVTCSPCPASVCAFCIFCPSEQARVQILLTSDGCWPAFLESQRMRGASAGRGVRSLLQSGSAEGALLAERLASSGLASASGAPSAVLTLPTRAEQQWLHGLVRTFKALAARSGLSTAEATGRQLVLRPEVGKVDTLLSCFHSTLAGMGLS